MTDKQRPVRVFLRARPATNENGERTTLLALAMAEAGLGSHRMERASGVSHGTIWKLARGESGVESRKAAAIARALDKNLHELFSHADGADPVGL